MKGLIVKGIGGFYYVTAQSGNTYRCRARGLFKKDGITPMVGDSVEIELLEEDEGVVEKIYPRKNLFIRPAVSNIEQMVIVVSVSEPEPNFSVIDKFTVMSERAETEVLLIINKIDLAKPGDLEKIEEIYGNVYETLEVSALTGEGIEQLESHLAGKVSAFAGSSGVGKSTLINALAKRNISPTGSLSDKSGRGKHTTRHVEIFTMDFGGKIFDTPGFTSFEVLEGSEDDLQYYYPEMKDFLGECKYSDCKHIKEPDCAVRRAVEAGEISAGRYESYVAQFEELREKNNIF